MKNTSLLLCLSLICVATATQTSPLKGQIPPRLQNNKLEDALKNENLIFQDYITADRSTAINSEDDNFYKKLFQNALDATSTTPHEANYILPLNYSLDSRPEHEKRLEAKFQISFKTPILNRIATLPLNLYFSYTQRSFWQLYNAPESRPFRENNYQPELFLNYESDSILRIADHYITTFDYVNIGYMHESNGGDVSRSRSWDRIVFSIGFKRHYTTLRYKAWLRLHERSKESPIDTRGDDNPDILYYLGYSELYLEQVFGKHIFSTTIRPVLFAGRGSIMIDYAYPMSNDLHWYIQGFYGYGESLFDYNNRVRRLGFGFRLFL